ncbi:MAG TPA: argininosuccinate lyase [Candidatus Omnitrophota bacterium]|nr:argininosuccinate lyase [Candidatus Omnitrophota bacterium]
MTKLWGSRFEKKSDPLADQFSFSISYDYRLAKYDCLVGIAHAKMLAQHKIIPAKDAQDIVSGLKKILKQIEEGVFVIDQSAEDIHTQIQAVLKEEVGDAADKLHTARSRNDLVVTDMKLYCLESYEELCGLLTKLQKTLIAAAKNHTDTVIPAYTHLQAAQVVSLAHHLLAYVEMLDRDKSRLKDAIDRAHTMPLGSAALSGTSLPITRNEVAKELGFKDIAANSIDAVSDRDFIMEGLSALAIMAVHFSRIAEDLIIWSTNEFKFIDIDWSLCTGSSIMPHKKNPDILELIRGEAATIISNLNQLLVLVKGLPLTYNRDLQLDKPPLFESVEKIGVMLKLLDKTFATLKINQAVLEKRTQDESFFTVDIMEYLIKKGVSYREAHDIVGKMVKECLDRGVKISSLSKNELQKYSDQFELDVKKLLNPKTSVKIKKSFGSTSPSSVAYQLRKWDKELHA